MVLLEPSTCSNGFCIGSYALSIIISERFIRSERRDLCAIGARIKAAREKAGMTQEDLAAALEMSPTHISVIERGVKSPKLETLVNIANVLNVSSDMLLQDVVNHASDGIASELSMAISKLSKKDQERMLNAIRALTE